MNSKTFELPKSLKAERGLFTLLFQDPDRLVEVIDRLEPQDFYSIGGQQLFKAITRLYKKNIKVDVISIEEELKREIEPQAALEELRLALDELPVRENLSAYVDRIKNSSLLRQVISLTNKQREILTEPDLDAKEVLVNLEAEILRLEESIKDVRPADVKGILGEIKKSVEANSEFGWKAFMTGFPKLDTATGGLMSTQTWVIGGYTGVGKTFVTLQILLNALECGAVVALFSTEMDRKINLLRMVGNLSGLGTLQLLRGKLTKEQLESRKEAEERIASYQNRLFIFDNVYSVPEIRLKAKQLKLKVGLDVLAVDFLQNLKGSADIYERTSNAAIELQVLSQELECCVLVVSQVSQEGGRWTGSSRMEVIQFKGAGEIAAVADVALWLKKTESKELLYSYLRKVRHGSGGRMTLKLDFPSGRITEQVETEDVLDTI